MLHALLDPIVLFFAAGLIAGALRSDLKLPDATYETIGIYLLLAIGLKGGIELSESPLHALWLPMVGTLALGVTIPIIAYNVLRRLGRFDAANAAAIAAHYGSVSAVTFAVVLGFLAERGEYYEPFVTVLLVVLEVPALAVGVLIARLRTPHARIRKAHLVRELLLGRSIFLLLAGLAIGTLTGHARAEAIAPVFSGLFKGVLAIFMLELGLVCAKRLGDLKSVGLFLLAFGTAMPVLSACLGIAVGWAAGMSLGGTIVLSTLAASASYIAAPAAMRIAVPEANPTLYLTAALGITFPFNVLVGIPLYARVAEQAFSLAGGPR